MKKKIAIVLCTACALSVSACAAKEAAPAQASGAEGAEQKEAEGKAKGFGGVITAKVTLEGDKITALEVTGDNETKGIGTNALEQLPEAILKAGNTEVDIVAGATVTSDAIIAAVNNAINPDKYPYEEEEKTEETQPEALTAADVYQGVAVVSSGRIGPGADDKEVPVYSVNEVFANVLFDGDGKILNLYVDQMEYATPNYDGETMPHLTGFPSQSYNNDENHDEKVDGILEQTEENFMKEIEDWKTKRERGNGYVMGTGTWSSQMDEYQRLFTGKTAAEVSEWFEKYCSDVNGRPLKKDSDKEEDVKKYEALDEADRAVVDGVTGATMSLNDSHGNIVGAIEKAYENRVPLEVSKVSAMGFGVVSSGRTGPGKDDKEVPVYSINQVMAGTLFDDEGKIAAVYVDQIEIATPNYDGETMPHLTGFPGQVYNNDEDHDGKVDSVLEQTEENFMKEIEGWKTKRERGSGYVMGTGTWSSQMDEFQKLFVGKTVDEVEAWFEKYCSDINGRPLKKDSDKEEDVKKYEALDEADKAVVDGITGATMSLNDSHGNIIAAIRASFDNKINIDLTIE